MNKATARFERSPHGDGHTVVPTWQYRRAIGAENMRDEHPVIHEPAE